MHAPEGLQGLPSPPRLQTAAAGRDLACMHRRAAAPAEHFAEQPAAACSCVTRSCSITTSHWALVPAQVDYTMRTLAGKHLSAARSELAAADVPGALACWRRHGLPPVYTPDAVWQTTRQSRAVE